PYNNGLYYDKPYYNEPDCDKIDDKEIDYKLNDSKIDYNSNNSELKYLNENIIDIDSYNIIDINSIILRLYIKI
ncbi:10771_t:CDS:2, partial [Cetraspora pellucida]